MENFEMLKQLFDQKKIAVISALLVNPDKEFYLKELSDSAKVPIATTLRILHKLVDLKVVNEHQVSKFKLYQIADNETVSFLASFIRQEQKVIPIFVKKVASIEGVRAIIQHGEEKDNKASTIILGDRINTDAIKAVVSEIFTEFKVVITFLTLTRDQFEQMREMGLYPGQKRILFEK